jgi:hypothetical protein
MKHLYLTIAGLMIASISFGQIVFESNFDIWTDTHTAAGWTGSRTNIESDSVLQITTGATMGLNLMQLTNVNGTHKRMTTQGLPLQEGLVYEVEVWVKGNGKIRTGLFDSDMDGFDFGFQYNSYETISSTTVTSFIQTITPDTTFSSCELIISTLEGIVQIDRVELRSGEIQVPVAKTVYEIQYTTNTDGVSPESGVYVITTGVVTGVTSNGYYIQDGAGSWNGIRVMDSSNTPSQGDLVTVTGTVEEFFSFTRINGVTDFTNVGPGTIPAPSIVGSGALNAEQYESVLVRTTGTCTSPLNTFNEWLINDGTGEVMVDDEMFMYTPTVGISYMVTGPLNYAFSAYKIEPRDAGDVSLASGLNELSGIQTKVYPNPTSDILTIEQNQNGRVFAQIFDAQGKQVLALTLSNKIENISLAALANGIYCLQLSTEGASGVSMIEVQH